MTAKKQDFTSPLARAKTKLKNYNSGSVHEPPPSRLNPHEGYCFIFARETAEYELFIEGQRLVAREKPHEITNNTNTTTKWFSEYFHKMRHVELDEKEKDNLLYKLKRSKVLYDIQPARDGKHFLVLVSMALRDAEQWADEHDTDIEIEPKEAVRVGRDTPHFALAHRTYLPEDESKVFKDEAGEFNKLDLSLWNHIHIPYEPAIDQSVYKIKGHNGSVLDNRLFLRVLYEYMTADEGSGGCGFNIDMMLANSAHPMVSFFATNDPKHAPPKLTLADMVKPTMALEEKLLYQVREYYGEMLGFYFAFLMHYQRCLLYAVPVGFLFFIIQISVGQIDIPGSLFLVILAIMWSTITIETWYRRENALKFEWGMLRYEETEVPRPNFEGVLEVSKVTGEIVEVVASRVWYFIKIMLSMSGILCCLAGIITVVVEIWTLQRSLGENNEMSVYIGMLNAVQITIFNYIYVYLAMWLNEKEGHRLQEEWYNHLVIKRVFFYLVNSFNSLIYLAFVKTYDSNEECLRAVRIQLVTLFLSMIFIQNTMEVFVPKMMMYLTVWLRSRNKSESEQRLIGRQQPNMPDNVVRMNDPAIHRGDNAIDIAVQKHGEEEKDSLIEKNHEDKDNHNGNPAMEEYQKNISQISPEELERLEAECKAADEHDLVKKLSVDTAMWEDVWAQFALLEPPAVLDNTAEIVVQYGYIMLFVLVLPLMFLLAVINNFVEFRLDFYELTQSRRGVPYAASGLGVWKQVMSTISTTAVFSNLAIITWKTDLTKVHFTSSTETNKVLYFFGITFILLLFQFIARFCIADVTPETKYAIERQEACEKYLLLGEMKKTARHAKESEIEEAELKEDEAEKKGKLEIESGGNK